MKKLTTKEMRGVLGRGRVECEPEDALGCTSCIFKNWDEPTEYWCCDFEEAGGIVCVET